MLVLSERQNREESSDMERDVPSDAEQGQNWKRHLREVSRDREDRFVRHTSEKRLIWIHMYWDRSDA